jgi:hypothetical protein
MAEAVGKMKEKKALFFESGIIRREFSLILEVENEPLFSL